MSPTPPRFEHMYTRVSTPPTSTTASASTTSTKEPAMRINPSDVLFALGSIALLIASAFALGGLMAHPF